MADRDPKIFTLSSGSTTESTFDAALRGYDRKQVDHYVARGESQIAGLIAERDEVLTQAQLMAGQIQQLQSEMQDLRRKLVVERPSFKHLGARAEQILSLVEEEAEEITKRAEREAADRAAEMDRHEADRRSALEAEFAKRNASIQEAVDKAERQASAVRAEAERNATRTRDQAQARAEATRTQAEQYAAGVRSKIELESRTMLDSAKREAALVVSEARADAGRLVADAERKVIQLEERRRTVKSEMASLRQAVARLTGTSAEIFGQDDEDDADKRAAKPAPKPDAASPGTASPGAAKQKADADKPSEARTVVLPAVPAAKPADDATKILPTTGAKQAGGKPAAPKQGTPATIKPAAGGLGGDSGEQTKVQPRPRVSTDQSSGPQPIKPITVRKGS